MTEGVSGPPWTGPDLRDAGVRHRPASLRRQNRPRASSGAGGRVPAIQRSQPAQTVTGGPAAADRSPSPAFP